jgi:hypothetical protein
MIRSKRTAAQAGGWPVRLARSCRCVVAAALAAVAFGCGEDARRQRPAGSALWVDAGAEALPVAAVSRLEAAGIGELFLDAARVEWSGDSAAVEPVALAVLPRARAMLVVRGKWPSTVADAAAAARSLATPLEAIRRRAEDAGILVAGWHLDLDGPPGEGQGELVGEVRGALAPDLLLAVTVSRQALTSEAVREVLEPADLAVAFLYGAREGEADAPESWDLQHVTAAVRRLEELGEPYLVGAVIRGAATQLRGGQEVAEVSGTSLAEMAWNRALRLQHGFSLAGVDRQVYEFTAQAPTRLGSAQLRSGDLVRVVGTSSAHLKELRRTILAAAGEGHLGELYYRLPHSGDSFTLGVDNLLYAASEGGEPPTPRPLLTVETLSRGEKRLVVRLTLVNDSGEPSDLGQVESNFVEMISLGGSFGDVAPGDFYRYDLLAPGRDGTLERSIRSPRVVRLFAPMLAARAELRSGPIEIHASGRELRDLQVRSTFLAPYGASVDTGPVSWTELAPQPTPTPTPAP